MSISVGDLPCSKAAMASRYSGTNLILGSGQHRRMTLASKFPAVCEGGEPWLCAPRFASTSASKKPKRLLHAHLIDADSLRAEPTSDLKQRLAPGAEDIKTGGLISPGTVPLLVLDKMNLYQRKAAWEDLHLRCTGAGQAPSAAPSSVVLHCTGAEMQRPLPICGALRKGLLLRPAVSDPCAALTQQLLKCCHLSPGLVLPSASAQPVLLPGKASG